MLLKILIITFLNFNNCFIINNNYLYKPKRYVINDNSKLKVIMTESETRLEKKYYHYLVKYNKIDTNNNNKFLLSNSKNKFKEYLEDFRENYEIFQKNYKLINNHNNLNQNLKLGMNQFMDQIDFSDDLSINKINDLDNNNFNYLNNNNFNDLNNNMIKESTIFNNDINGIKKIFSESSDLLKIYLNLPPYINWEDKLSETKNQGNCGSCWAFSSTNSIESLMRINNFTTERLSEQELVDFSYSNNGCNGGLMHLAFDYCKENNGLVSNINYPYMAKRTNLNNSQIISKFDKVIGSNISGYQFIIPRSKLDMMASLNKGPISLAIDASPFIFRFYKEGIIDIPSQSTTNINHAILLTGYNIQGNNSYWIIQNSWGKDWGQDGFAKIKMKNGRGVLDCQLYGVYPLYNKN